MVDDDSLVISIPSGSEFLILRRSTLITVTGVLASTVANRGFLSISDMTPKTAPRESLPSRNCFFSPVDIDGSLHQEVTIVAECLFFDDDGTGRKVLHTRTCGDRLDLFRAAMGKKRCLLQQTKLLRRHDLECFLGGFRKGAHSES